MYRVYCEGTEFGTDYRTLEKAREVMCAYRRHFPKLNYYIRRVGAKREN